MPNLFEKALPARLVKRVAEAADGVRNGLDIFVVVNEKDFDRCEIFKTRKAAENFIEKQTDKEDWVYFGPFRTKDESKSNPVEEIESIRIIITYKPSSKIPPVDQTIMGEIDSIFLNLSAIEKFVIPYYVSLYGAEYGLRLYEQFKKLFSEAGFAKGPIVQHVNRTITGSGVGGGGGGITQS